MDRKYAKYLLEKTTKDYNLIAKDYARTRAYIPKDIETLGEYTWEGERVLDLGCANGRLFEILNGKNVDYFGVDISEKLIEMVWASTAELAIVPMQDLLGLNGKARMNIPGTATGNWTWRYGKTALKKNHLTFFNRLNTIYNRNNG